MNMLTFMSIDLCVLLCPRKSLIVFTIKNDGNVGIGIVNPQIKLDVNGAGRFTESISASRVIAGYDAGISGSVSCSNWFRSSGK